MTLPKQALIAIAGVGSMLLLMFAILVYIVTHPDEDHEVSGPIDITQQWKQITPESALIPERSQQYVILVFTPQQVFEYNGWDRMGEGDKMTVPEVELVGEGGRSIRLKAPDVYSTEVRYVAAERLEQWQPYRSVRVKSDRPITCAGIVWRNTQYK